MLGPLAAIACAFLATAWAVRQAADRQAAVIALVLLGCLSPLALQFLTPANAHGHTVVHMALLGAAAVVLAKHGARWAPGDSPRSSWSSRS